MGKEAYFEQDIKARAKEIENPEDVLCIGSLTLTPYSSAARATMLTQHLVQALVPNNPEVPAVSTTHEHMFGEFSHSFKKTTNKFKVYKKIDKHPGYVYTLVVYDSKNNRYDIINRTEAKNLAESYGYKIDNDCIDSFKEGDIIPKNTMLYKSPCIDEHQNYMYGVNAKVVYVVSQETIEDAIVVSESFANKLSTTKVETCTVPFNDNDIMLNLYGNNNEYKSFPDIGEKTKKSIICGVRRRNKLYDQINLKNSNLKKIFPNDDIIQKLGSYTITDIDIWSNKSYDEIPDLPAYSQVKRYYKQILDYYQNIYDILGEIIDGDNDYSDELSRLYAKARDYLNPNCKFIDEDKMFSNMIIEFTMIKSEKLIKGCKLSGRYGNKSVISEVIPDEEMGITEDGIIPDVRIDALGILGRLNSGQCVEQELNWIAEIVRHNMEAETSDKGKLKLLFKFLDLVNKEESKQLKTYLDDLEKSDGKEAIHDFIQEIIDDRIYITQNPMQPITGDGLKELYDTYSPTKTKLIYKDEDGNEYKTLRSVIVADEYILRLKQEPKTKFSVRSKSMINPRSFLPIKSTKAAKSKSIFPDQSNRIGEQELNILLLENDPDAINTFYKSYSTSIEDRRALDLFESDPSKGHIINNKLGKSIPGDMTDAYLKAMGRKLTVEYDESEDMNDDSVDIDIPELPNYIKKLY
jgi:DNA-directed RNA polymerase beta subunit